MTLKDQEVFIPGLRVCNRKIRLANPTQLRSVDPGLAGTLKRQEVFITDLRVPKRLAGTVGSRSVDIRPADALRVGRCGYP